MMVGKAHFGSMGTPAANPLTIGFDYNIAGHAAGAVQHKGDVGGVGYNIRRCRQGQRHTQRPVAVDPVQIDHFI